MDSNPPIEAKDLVGEGVAVLLKLATLFLGLSSWELPKFDRDKPPAVELLEVEPVLFNVG